MVRYGVYDVLDDAKANYQGLPDFLTSVAKQELQRIPQHLRKCAYLAWDSPDLTEAHRCFCGLQLSLETST